MVDWIGRTLSKVRIEMLLARGGMADVYLGTHTTLQRPVAVKILRDQYQDDPDLLDRFQREARVVAMLRNPNIVQVFDFDTVDNRPYLVMEYVSGITLSTFLRDLHQHDKRLELPLVSRILTTLAGALHYAHERGVIHRDIKPSNVMLTSPTAPVAVGQPLPADFEPVLTDFGLVRFLRSAKQTATGQIAGTPAYMSPEQARGEQTDERTDIYSLGIVMYEILASHVPFEADTTMGVLLKHINEPPPPIPDLPPALQTIISRVLAKKPAERFQTAPEFAGAFRSAIHRQTEAVAPLPANPDPILSSTQKVFSRPAMQPYRLPAILTGSVIILLGAFFLLRPLFLPAYLPPLQTTEIAETPYVEIGKKIGVLRFQDGAARLDQATMTGIEMPLPAEGNQYEVWLIDVSGEQRRSLGILQLNPSGNGSIAFVDSEGRNLLERFNQLEITVEPSADSNPNPTNQVAYSVTLPAGGLTHVRHLLVSFGAAPNETALVQGLLAQTGLVDQAAHDMLNAYQEGNEAKVRLQAEIILNLLVGSQSAVHKDWNGDGQISDPGDGYGLLLNGDNNGYIEGAYTHADFAVTSADASENMKVHGEHVKISVQNMEQWAPQLSSLTRQILEAPFGPEMEAPIRQAVALADEMLNGTDLNGNEQIEPIPGEGGAKTAHDHAYYMADLSIVRGGE